MSQSDQNLQNILSDILKDLMSMSADVIKKSKVYLDNVESEKSTSIENFSIKVNNLLDRINSNVTSFKNTYDTATNNHKLVIKTESVKFSTSPKKKLSLSLRKNGDSHDTDVDSINSDEENLTPNVQEKSPPKKNTQENDNTNHADTDSETDGEKTIMNFDASASHPDLTDDEFMKAVKEIDSIKESEAEKAKEPVKNSFESESFDFDEECDNEKIQRENNELLDLLNRAVGTSPEPEPEQAPNTETEPDAEMALKILELEVSADIDSDESLSSVETIDEWKPDDVYNSSDSDGNISDTESLAEDNDEDQIVMKNCEIYLSKKIDQFSENEIAKLCNIENINKRKCLKALSSLRKKRRKRIRILCSSSSSLSSDISSNGSTTPDLVIDTQPQSPGNFLQQDVSVLADALMDKLEQSDEDVEISSDTSSDLESEKTFKIKRKTEINKSEDSSDDQIEIVLNKETKDDPKLKKYGSWRNDIFFGTSSESENDEPVVVANNTDEKLEEDSKETLKLRLQNDGETMVITDSDSDSDDVTFVDECLDDSTSSRGRRNIRTILSDDELSELTQRAKTEEDQRIERLEKHTKNLESVQSQREDLVLDVDKSGNPLITVDYNLTNILKPHQKEGVQFMWEACYESVETLKKNPGTGCILAHCMGLGKTLQVITLIHTLFTHKITKTNRVLITCPLSTVSNWKNEFLKSFERVKDHSEVRRYFLIKGELTEKVWIVNQWRRTGGVLVMGYETFQILTNEKMSSRVSPSEKKDTYEALINPGPDLIVCDEGHQLKNDRTLRTKALMQVKTKRRIVLTGTPLQNNLKEYYYMVEFVKPHILGTYKEYTNRFAHPIQNGQYHDSTPEDTKLMKKRTHVLTKLLKKTIHRVEASVLASYLPQIIDYTIFIKLTDPQMLLYAKYIEMVKKQGHDLCKGFLNDVMMLSLNNLHPYTIQLYYNKLKSNNKKKKRVEEDDQEIANEIEHISSNWYQNLLTPDVATNINLSSKLTVIFDILDECLRLNEKVLIFAQRLIELDVIENFLKVCGTKNYRCWRPGTDYYRMDGTTLVENREKLCKNFNTNSSSKVFLLTHRVGGLGLNLTGANRVIMIGSNHNPSLDAQSMYRVYRFGQTKKCYIYRLISLATMEEKIYHRCVVKLHLSGTVVDKLHFVRRYTANDLQEMYKVNFTEYIQDRPFPALPVDIVLATLLKDTLDIYKYHLHDSLLENRPEEELTDEEKKSAWQEFNNMEEAARTPVASLVPNPMNNNVRGFIPRALIGDAARPSVIQNTSTNFPSRRPSLFDSNLPQAGPSTSNTPFTFVPSMPRPSVLSPEQTMQNLRASIVSMLRAHPRPGDEPTSGEFNYALNKVI